MKTRIASKIFLAFIWISLFARLSLATLDRLQEPPDPAETLSAETQTLFWTDEPTLALMPENPFGIDMRGPKLGRRGYAEINGQKIWFAENPPPQDSTELREGGFTWFGDNLAELEIALDPAHNLETRSDYQNAQNHLSQPHSGFLMAPLSEKISTTSPSIWVALQASAGHNIPVSIFVPRDKSKLEDPTRIRATQPYTALLWNPETIQNLDFALGGMDFAQTQEWLKEWPLFKTPTAPVDTSSNGEFLWTSNFEEPIIFAPKTSPKAAFIAVDNFVHFQVHFWNFSATLDSGLKRFDDGLSLTGSLNLK